MIPLFSLDRREQCYSHLSITDVTLAAQIKQPGLLQERSATAVSCFPPSLLIVWKYGSMCEAIWKESAVKQIQRGSHTPDSFSVSRLLQDTTEEIKGERENVNEGNSKPSLPQDNSKACNCEKKGVKLKGGALSYVHFLYSWIRSMKPITFLTCNST